MLRTNKSSARLLWPLLAGALLIAACGDDDVDSPWDLSEEANQRTDDGCGDDGVENPITGECIVPNDGINTGEPSDNQNDGQDPEDDQTDDPPTNNGHIDDDNSAEDECGPADLVGTTCHAGGEALIDVTVTLSGTDCDGNDFEEFTTSDSDGNYSFEDIPSGTHELTFATGSFSSTHDVQVDYDSTTDLDPVDQRLCLEPDSANIAVLDGQFDDISGILDDLGMDYNLYPSGDFPHGDIDTLTDYDIIFAECANNLPSQSNFSTSPADALRYFVQNGGSLYASDMALTYITGAFDDVFILEEGLRGTSTTVEAQIPNPALADLLGTDVATIEMPSQFIFFEDILVDATIHFEAEFEADEVPGGPSSGDSSTTVSAPLMAHHRDPINNGRVFYTSFHNSAQAPDKIRDIFEFLVFQL